MANTKGGTIRQRVIDRCLSSERGFSIAEMMEKCNRELEERFLLPVTAMNTIRDDIDEIKNSYHVSVESIRFGRNIRYRYKDRGFSIYKAPLNEKDLANLKEMLSSLSAFHGRPQFEWLEETSARIQETLSCHQKPKEPCVGFDDNPDLKGKEFFQPLFTAIIQRRAIELVYRSFRQEQGINYIVHPYFLKQYNNRWFLFGCTDGYDNLSSFALDRIRSVKDAEVSFKPNDKFDFASYFDDIVGVSKPKGDAEVVRICVSSSLKPYILTKPIHSSQTIVEENECSVIIEIKVIPNFELEQLILSYGEGLKVLSPDTLRQRIKEKIKKSAENYD